uniref:Uncharacterized protein n=1 Tax=mine drainage metagenome TaxID=410659 RepID=E6PIT4_9ZZZZ
MTPASTRQPLVIPRTIRFRYLSGIVALNILSEDGTGDWHPHILSEPLLDAPATFLAGEGEATNAPAGSLDRGSSASKFRRRGYESAASSIACSVSIRRMRVLLTHGYQAKDQRHRRRRA